MPTTSRTYATSTTTIGAIILRDAWTCAYCEEVLEVVGVFNGERAARIVFDHVIPRTKNGSSRHWNITTCCRECNIIKGETSVVSIFPRRVAFVEARLALPLDRAAGRALGDDLYPWAEEYRRTQAEKSLARYHARRSLALADGLGGLGFPFGKNLEAEHGV